MRREQSSFLFLKSSIAVIIGVVLAYQIATLARQGLWSDEIYTVMVTRPEHSFTEMFQKYLLSEDTPPLHYILMHFWQLIAPSGDWSMRVPGLYFYVLTIAAAALYPCQAMNTARRITFISLVGCGFGTIFFAQEVRSYALFGLLATCILYDMLDHGVALDGGREPSWARLGWSAVLGLAASYTHYFGFLFFGAAVIALLGYGIARGRIPWRIIAMGCVVAGGLFPWIVVRFSAAPVNPFITDRPIGVLRGFLRHLVGSPFAAGLIAILGLWALFLHMRVVLGNRHLWLILAAIAINLLVSILSYFHTPILVERALTGVRIATLLAFSLIISEILSDRRAQALLIATSVALFVSFIITEKPKSSWREPAAYVSKHTRCERREILAYPQYVAGLLSYYLPDERFVIKGSNFDPSVVRELDNLNETRPGCDVVAIALNLNPNEPAEREEALAATPFRGPGFHVEEWPSAFVVRRNNS
jgi:hypothetical protein